MAGTTRPIATPRNPTRGEAAIQEFAISSLTYKQSRQRVALLLKNRELLRDVQGLTPEDQAGFVEKVDQVRRGGSFSSLEIFHLLFLQRHIQLSTCKM